MHVIVLDINKKNIVRAKSYKINMKTLTVQTQLHYIINILYEAHNNSNLTNVV